jgi:tRNA dimethylallyltransferase
MTYLPGVIAPAILLMGPTAAGKTALAVELAQKLDGEIISVDSAQVFIGMDIGTAKPGLAERGGIPHHLLDILDPAEAFSTGQFKERALTLIDAIRERGKIPILSGGTMLYFNALNRGLAQLPPADPAVRGRLEDDLKRQGSKQLHRRLTAIDPVAAERIHPNDPQRLQRALEVYEISGRPLSSFFAHTEKSLALSNSITIVVAPLVRSILHEKIALRFRQMLQQGLVEEVERLFRRDDLNETLPSIKAVGYRQVWAYLQGKYDYSTLCEKGIIATRQLAKRQYTWLRKEAEATWFDAEEPCLADAVLAYIRTRLRAAI